MNHKRSRDAKWWVDIYLGLLHLWRKKTLELNCLKYVVEEQSNSAYIMYGKLYYLNHAIESKVQIRHE